MKLNPITKRGITLWLIGLGFFGLASAFGYLKGGTTTMEVARQFHETRSAGKIDHGHYDEAIQEYKAWIWLEPDNDQLKLKLAELHLGMNEAFEAQDRIAPLLDKMKIDDYALCRLMALACAIDSDPEAVEWARRAQVVANDAQKTETILLKANAHRALNQVVAAKSAYAQVIEQAPDHAEAHYRLYQYAEMEMKAKMMVAELKQVATTSSSHGYTPAFERSYQHLKRAYPTLLKQHNSQNNIAEKLGNFAREQGLWDEAMKHYTEATTLKSATWISHYWLALNAEHQDDLPAARKHLEQALSLNPNQPKVTRNLQRLNKSK